MKKILNSKILIFVISLLIGTGIGLRWVDVTEKDVKKLANTDLVKISKAFEKTDSQVQYDYLHTSFSVDSSTLISYLAGLKSENTDLLIKFGFKDGGKEFKNFTMALSSVKNKDADKGDLPLDSTKKWENKFSENYSEAYKKVKDIGNFLYGRVPGHDNDFYKGVSFNIDECISFIDSNKAERYYFYPVLAKKEKGSYTKPFTSIVISNNPRLRKDMGWTEERLDGTFYGDHGTGCCP